MLGAAAIAAGCSVEGGEALPEESVGEVSEALMCAGDSKFKTEATLAAVVAKELGRWGAATGPLQRPGGAASR